MKFPLQRNLISLRQDNASRVTKPEPKREKPALTVKEQNILHFIADTITHTGKAPTVREIGAAFGHQTTGHTQFFLKGLKDKGYISVPKIQKWRGITIL